MHALSRNMSTNTPGSPRSETTLVANVTSVSVMDAETSIAATAKGSVPAMPVPLFDTDTPLEPLRARLNERAVGGARRRALHPRPRGRGLRERVRRLRRRRPRRRGGQRHRRDHDRAARHGRGRGRRRRRAVLHLLRQRRGDPAHRRAAGVLRRRPRHLLRHRRTRCARRSPRRPRRSWPWTCSATSRRSPTSRRSACRCSRTRRRRPARTLGGARAGSFGTAATFSFFPSKNLGGFGDGGDGRDATTPASPSARGCCASTARRDKVTYTEVGYNSRLDELQAGAAPRAAARARRLVRRSPRGRAALRGGGPRRARRSCRARWRAPTRPGTST